MANTCPGAIALTRGAGLWTLRERTRSPSLLHKQPERTPDTEPDTPHDGGVLNPLKNTTNTSHNELLHQDPLQPPLEPRGRNNEASRIE